MARVSRLSRADKEKLVSEIPYFFHSVDCGDGVVTPGKKSLELLRDELRTMRLPSLSGKTVLDIGAWDGFFSFAAEDLGAERVVALDHYVWSMDHARRLDYRAVCDAEKRDRQPYHRVPGVWEPSSLPGKRAFDLIHRLRESRVEQIVSDFMTADLVELGAFDVVFFLGVLYHMSEPLTALKRLSLVTRELAIIETAAIYLPGHEEDSLFEFYGKGELHGDTSNWFAPNLAALKAICAAAGFRSVELVSTYPPQCDGHRCRLTVHARN